MCFGLFDLGEIRPFLTTRTILSNAWVEARNWNVEQAFKRLKRFERFVRDVVRRRNSSTKHPRRWCSLVRAVEGAVTPEIAKGLPLIASNGLEEQRRTTNDITKSRNIRVRPAGKRRATACYQSTVGQAGRLLILDSP